MLHSTLGRHGARAIRAAVYSELAMQQWQLLLDNVVKGDTTIYNRPEFPKGTIEGVGFHEAPRGTLSHWVVVEDGKIKNYQAVVPTTWNASPRDRKETSDRTRPRCSATRRAGRSPARSAPHHPLVRSLHGLRGPCIRSRAEAACAREGAWVVASCRLPVPTATGNR
jgi:hypothetical protein